MVDVDFSPYDVLRSGTYNPASILGRTGGSRHLREGKHADLVLLEANPLEEITNSRQIAGTIADGHRYPHADLDLMLEEVANDHEAAETTQSVIEIAFPIVVIMGLAVMGYLGVRRVRQGRENQVP